MNKDHVIGSFIVISIIAWAKLLWWHFDQSIFWLLAPAILLPIICLILDKIIYE